MPWPEHPAPQPFTHELSSKLDPNTALAPSAAGTLGNSRRHGAEAIGAQQ